MPAVLSPPGFEPGTFGSVARVVLDEVDRANASALVPELRAIRERRPAEETASGSIAPTDRVYADNHEAVAKATTESCEDRIAGTGFPRPQ